MSQQCTTVTTEAVATGQHYSYVIFLREIIQTSAQARLGVSFGLSSSKHQHLVGCAEAWNKYSYFGGKITTFGRNRA